MRKRANKLKHFNLLALFFKIIGAKPLFLAPLHISFFLYRSLFANYNLVYFGVEKSYLVIGSPVGKLSSNVLVTKSE